MNIRKNHTLQIGTVIQDKWIILEFIGQGGMGEVYRAHQLNLKRDVAFKIISREWLLSVEENEEEFELGLQRFRNEVLAMAQIRHPNLIQIYDYGSFSPTDEPEAQEIEYIVMEYIPGGSLRATMSEDGFYPEEELVRDWIARYFLPMLNGVQALHTAGIIHRDLKPGNVLLDGNTPRITDFGLARSSRIRPVTISIDIKGTPAYMSPEHFMDLKRTDQRSDIYSLGKILYEAIEGKITSDAIPFRSVHLSNTNSRFFKKFDQIIRKATAEDREQRYESVENLQRAILDGVSQEGSAEKLSKPEKRKRVKWNSRFNLVTGIVFVVVLLVLAGSLWYLFEEPEPIKPILQPKNVPTLPSEENEAESLLSKAKQSNSEAPLPPFLTGRDGAKLILIKGNRLHPQGSEAKETKKSIGLKSFYMDETEVTNHQYVQFLNEVSSKIRIEEKMVKTDGVPWLFLGEVVKDYEPIVMKEGKFMVKDPVYHSHPVVRVTAYGASAFAKHYGRRLPTDTEWRYALNKGKGVTAESSSPLSTQSTDSHMKIMHGQDQNSSPGRNQSANESPVSVTQSRSDQLGLRGLDENVDEWGLLTSPQSKDKQYVIFPEEVERYPWEAFSNVGFRTVLPFPE